MPSYKTSEQTDQKKLLQKQIPDVGKYSEQDPVELWIGRKAEAK